MVTNSFLRLKRSLGRARRLRAHQREVERVDFINDVTHRLPALQVKTVFDVGANVGLTALLFSDVWPDAKVYAFEPSQKNRELMGANLAGKPGIKIIPMGLSDEPKTADLLYDVNHPTMSRLGEGEGVRETIELDTVDRFSSANNITYIDVMKIDVEGHEEQVLKGASQMLTERRIRVIKAECAIDPDHAYHTQLEAVTDIVHPAGYRLFGFYEQTEDVFCPGPRLRRFDVAFISADMLKR